MKEPLLYRIVRPLITLLFYMFFHPNIIGKENIPEKGKIILAGNHTNFLDCLLLISSTKRPIHFLAKQELLNGMFGFIFKNMGIIPVNRKAKRNNEAFDAAINCLNSERVIGIFPESTINRTKTEITIPFKNGAVRMAFQSGSEIIPFSITGKYNIFGKGVTLVFEKPYAVESDNYMHEIDKLREKINTMIIERR
ncbi:MAG: 1-acyl-sn-glycerol-3-phosphate acyltransferase [Bacilli bacterium]|nr:1-acyl-sn-glycerol-3-phosphate acyltransferase [Bacilli bacterium]